MLIAQSCPTLCDPMDYSPPGSSVHGILQAKYWSGLPIPSPQDLCDSGIKPMFPAQQADSLLSEPLEKPRCICQLWFSQGKRPVVGLMDHMAVLFLAF